MKPEEIRSKVNDPERAEAMEAHSQITIAL
jgi:hypothetical protein